MKQTMNGSKSMILVSLIAVFVLVCATALCACGGAGKHNITYLESQADYENAPSYAAAGEELEVICLVDVCDASMAFYVDGEEVEAVYKNLEGYHIAFTMPDHDVTVEYRFVSDPNALA